MIRTFFRLALACCTVLSVAYDLLRNIVLAFGGSTAGKLLDQRAGQRGRIDVDFGMQILRDVHAAAESTGARAFLMSGTLLGMHREGRILSHDYDIDVGVFADDPALPDFLDDLAKAPGYRRKSATRMSWTMSVLNPWLQARAGDVLLHKVYFGKGENRSSCVDVFVHHPANGFLVHGNFRCLWINRPFETKLRDFGGVRFLVPSDVETYLTENYGDYRVEKRQFESSVDCPNTTNIYGFRAAMWLTGRLGYFLGTGDRRSRRIIMCRLFDFIRYGLLLKGTPAWRMNQYEDPPA